MANPPPNMGQLAEDWVEEICSKTFLADFTIRSPSYRKADGQSKEAADLLIVFGKTLMTMQVKTKLVSEADAVLNANDLSRAASAVGKATNQFRAMLEAANDPNFFTFQNARGCELKVERTQIENVVAIVVYGLVTPDGQFSDTRLRFTNSCLPEEAIAVHLFSMEEFRLLTLLADTFPDFLIFLETRALLHLQNLVHPHTFPEDIWTFLTFEPKRLLETIHGNIPVNLEGFHGKYLEVMQRWEDAEKPSYFVDWLIEAMYQGIDSPVEVSEKLLAKTKLIAPPGSLEAFQRIIPELAKLRRRDRTVLSESFADKIESAKTDGMAFRVIKFESHEEAFLLLAIEGERKDRQVALFNFARATAYKLGLRRVFGIATPPVSLGQASYDVVVCDAKDMKIDQGLVDAVKYFFREPREVIQPFTTTLLS